MSTTAQEVFEFRGVDDLYIAEVTQDDASGYVCGTPIYLSPVAEVGKSTDSASEAHYYDNKALIVVNSEGADEIVVTIAPPVLAKLAQITGRSFDATTGMMVDSPRQNKYFALMYRTKGTDGKYRYVSRLKGTFNIPDESVATEDDGTDTTNTEVTYTGVYTQYEFNKGIYDGSAWSKASAKGIVVDTRYGLANVADFFSAVQTPDTISVSTVTGIGVAPSTASVAVGDTVTLTASLVPTGASGTITWTSSAEAKATVEDGVVTGVAAGTATITATCGSYSDTCTVTVTAAE